MRKLLTRGYDVLGLDVLGSPTTRTVGSVTDRQVVRRALEGVDAVLHAAALHKPHVGNHTRQAFVDTNITGTVTLLEASVAGGNSVRVHEHDERVRERSQAAPRCPGRVDRRAGPLVAAQHLRHDQDRSGKRV